MFTSLAAQEQGGLVVVADMSLAVVRWGGLSATIESGGFWLRHGFNTKKRAVSTPIPNPYRSNSFIVFKSYQMNAPEGLRWYTPIFNHRALPAWYSTWSWWRLSRRRRTASTSSMSSSPTSAYQTSPGAPCTLAKNTSFDVLCGGEVVLKWNFKSNEVHWKLFAKLA